MADNQNTSTQFRQLVDDWREMYGIATDIVELEEYTDVTIEDGTTRPTWYKKFIDRFRELILDSGYDDLGTYGPGVVFPDTFGIVSDAEGNFWSPGDDFEFPYETTGAGLEEEGFIPADDDSFKYIFEKLKRGFQVAVDASAEAQQARDESVDARNQAVSASQASGDVNFFDTYADAEAASLSEGDIVEILDTGDRYRYESGSLVFKTNLRDRQYQTGTQPASTISDPENFQIPTPTGYQSLADALDRGVMPLSVFGVIPWSREAAEANGNAINAALEYCAENGYDLDLGGGVIFNSVPIVQNAKVRVFGRGNNYWQKLYTSDFAPQSFTAIVMTGTGPKNQTLFGVSSCVNWGAARNNPSQVAGYSDSQYRLESFITPNTSASGRSLRPFSAAWTVVGDAGNNQDVYGSSWNSFRVMPDAGGDDGMLDVRSSDRSITKPLSSGDWDVGFFWKAARQIDILDLQAVGQWRIAGGLIAPHAKAGEVGNAAYNNVFSNAVFNRLMIRSVDSAPVVATTTSTIDIPWADDHPFGADGDLSLILSTQGRGGDSFTYTGMQKITGGAYDILRLTGVTPNPTTSAYKIARVNYRGGGTSEMKFDNVEIQGFGHGSLVPSENSDLGGAGLNYFDKPLANLEISGNEITELDFSSNCVITGYETVAVHMHDCRNVILPTFWEMHNGGRIIASPARNTNIHAVNGVAATETMNVMFDPFGSTIEDGSLDMRPYITEMDSVKRFTDSQDDGFFTPVRLKSQRFGNPNTLDTLSALAAPKGGRAAIGRYNGTQGFFNPNADQFDAALYYDEPTDVTRVRKTIRSNTRNQAGLGEPNGEFSTAWATGFLSREFSVVGDDSVVSFTPARKGGLMFIQASNTEDLPLHEAAALIYFDVGSSLYIKELNQEGIGSLVETSSLDVNGTTGLDGSMTVAVRPDEIKIENRLGGNRIIRVTVIG